jgi:hypothetical protein
MLGAPCAWWRQTLGTPNCLWTGTLSLSALSPSLSLSLSLPTSTGGQGRVAAAGRTMPLITLLSLS